MLLTAPSVGHIIGTMGIQSESLGNNVTAMEQPEGYEFKHIEVPQNEAVVNVVTNDHAMFWWEVSNTQDIVSKKSQPKKRKFKADNLYSVVTTKKFVAIEFKRATNIDNLAKIKLIEQEYVQICIALANLGGLPANHYSMLPASQPPDFYSFSCLFDPGYWIWSFTWGPIRAVGEYGIGALFNGPLTYWKTKEGERQAQRDNYDALKSRLDSLINENKAILNVLTNFSADKKRVMCIVEKTTSAKEPDS